MVIAGAMIIIVRVSFSLDPLQRIDVLWDVVFYAIPIPFYVHIHVFYQILMYMYVYMVLIYARTHGVCLSNYYTSACGCI